MIVSLLSEEGMPQRRPSVYRVHSMPLADDPFALERGEDDVEQPHQDEEERHHLAARPTKLSTLVRTPCGVDTLDVEDGKGDQGAAREDRDGEDEVARRHEERAVRVPANQGVTAHISDQDHRLHKHL